jgi:ribosomal protein S12 methylthiotransferase accessory factor
MTPLAADRVDILDLEARLVSEHCGLLRCLFRVAKDAGEPALPLIYQAEIANHQFLDWPERSITRLASGRGVCEADARRGALGEAVERYCALRHPDGLRRAVPRELDAAVDPRRLVLYQPHQYAQLTYAPYTPDMPLDWTPGINLSDGTAVWLPAEAVYLGYTKQDRLLAQQTSNGLAAGPAWRNAAAKALLEVVERDAFIISWCAQLRPRRIDWSDLPLADIRGIAITYARRGVAIELFRLPSDHDIPVFAAVAFDERPDALVAAVVGLGCDLDPARAAAGAILEVAQLRPALRTRLSDPEVLAHRAALVERPSTVSELEDHNLLYSDQRMLPAFDRWRRNNSAERHPWLAPDSDDLLGEVTKRLVKTGATAYLADVTAPEIRALGLFAARAVIEDFQPIHFGHDQIRLAGPRLYRSAQVRRAHGRVLGTEDLNPLPHPLA